MSKPHFYAVLPAFLVGMECAAFGAASAWAIGELLQLGAVFTDALEVVALMAAAAATVRIYRGALAFEREREARLAASRTPATPPLEA
ncbi:MAG: hypothetical protein H6923_02130 [Alphaproteobacteria bacterium]|nr:hypothetical protein [Alphaproteobacteria bacterium]